VFADRLSAEVLFLHQIVDTTTSTARRHSDLQKAAHGTVLTFAQHRALLINSAADCDKRADKPNSARKPRRSVFNSEVCLMIKAISMMISFMKTHRPNLNATLMEHHPRS
jgi:hypothetical protein